MEGLLLQRFLNLPQPHNKFVDYDYYDNDDDYYNEKLRKMLKNSAISRLMNNLLEAINVKKKSKIRTNLNTIYDLSKLILNYDCNTFFYTIAYYLKNQLNMDFDEFLDEIKDINFSPDLNEYINNHLNNR